MNRVPFSARWDTLRDDSVVEQTKQYAKWTLPQLMADSETKPTRSRPKVERDYQEVGALLVNNLAAKLVQLLFPVNRAFFKVNLTPALAKKAESRYQKTEIASSLSRMEMDACQRLYQNSSYASLVLAAKHLIVTGNVLTYRDSKASRLVSYGLQQFVGECDGTGLPVEVILREYTFLELLPPDAQAAVRLKRPANTNVDPSGRTRVTLYTRIVRGTSRRGNPVWRVSQECEDVPVGSTEQYPEHLCPWQWVTWSRLPGESYGRGHVEDFAGGFAKLSDLSHAATLYGIEMSRVLHLVASGAGTDIDALQQAEIGESVAGTPGTVAAYEAGDGAKLQAIEATIANVITNLSRAFMYTGNVRDSERTTAFEIAQLAREAEATLGGTVSTLGEHWQTPLAHLLITEVEPGTLEGIVTKRIKLDVSAGTAAMGRTAEVQNLLAVAAEIAAALEILVAADPRIDRSKVLDMLYAGQSIDTKALFKDPGVMKSEEAAQALQSQGEQTALNAAGLAEQSEVLSQLQAQG